MYNEERKLQFIHETETASGNDAWISAVFNLIEVSERKLGRDIAEFTASEVGEALATPGVITAVTIENRIPLIVRYKKWCAEHGFESVQALSSEIMVDISDNIRGTMVAGPAHLASLLAESFPDVHKKSAKVIYRAYLWFAFSGMEKEEAVALRVSDVNIRQRKAHTNRDRWYTIHELGIRDVARACELKEFERNVRFGVGTFPRADGDLILRGRRLNKEIPPEKYIRETLRPTVQSGFKAAGHPGLSYDRIRKSGIFYEAFSREAIAEIPPNFYTLAHDDFELGHPEPVSPGAKHKSIQRINAMYNRDYSAWKRAFEPELREEFGVEKIPDLMNRL